VEQKKPKPNDVLAKHKAQIPEGLWKERPEFKINQGDEESPELRTNLNRSSATKKPKKQYQKEMQMKWKVKYNFGKDKK
jgi:hypothetical protein